MISSLHAAPVSEFIFEQAPFRSCHASTIVELRSGEFLAAWFGGTAEGRPDVAIWGSRKRGDTWSPPRELAREPDIATYNPVLFYTPDRRLWLYYKFGPHPDNWTASRQWSADDGQSWSPREHLPAGLYGPIRAKPLVLADGTIVSGTSVESYRSWACWVERSTDSGKTWSRHGPIVVAADAVRKPVEDQAVPAVPGSSEWDRTEGIIQPSVVPMGGKHLRFFARSTSRIGRICVSDSVDAGITWTAARPIDLPNPNSGIDAVALKDGRIVLVYNHTERGRTPLNLAVSRDGDHWKMFHVLESEPGEYSYPAMIQASNGDLHITYTWRRQRIKHVRVPAGELPE